MESTPVKALIKADSSLIEKVEVYLWVEGIGDITALTLTADLPKLGQLTKKISALVSVAPFCRDSGTQKRQANEIGRTNARPFYTLHGRRKN